MVHGTLWPVAKEKKLDPNIMRNGCVENMHNKQNHWKNTHTQPNRKKKTKQRTSTISAQTNQPKYPYTSMHIPWKSSDIPWTIHPRSFAWETRFVAPNYSPFQRDVENMDSQTAPKRSFLSPLDRRNLYYYQTTSIRNPIPWRFWEWRSHHWGSYTAIHHGNPHIRSFYGKSIYVSI